MKKVIWGVMLVSLGIGFLGWGKRVRAKEPGQVMIVNQVRGRSCCGEGSIENLEYQLEMMEEKGLKGFWLLRYDALEDEEIMEVVEEYWRRGVVNPGILVEVIPDLAGNEVYEEEGEWYEARKVFSMGYGQAERKEMVDRLMRSFYERFGFYPKMSGGWMIDAYSLEYMQEEYGIKVHELTKEQWGTDTYKLYGGLHYPYLASSNWPQVPDFEEGEVLVIRQTISDPLYNYGDDRSIFTSQPNDYARGGRGFDYFKALFDQAVVENGWGVLGLENSMKREYQEEFNRQIEYVSSMRERGLVEVVSEIGQLERWKKGEVRVYQGEDLLESESEEKVWWAESGSYRVRIRSNGEEVFIDDIRVYEDWQDPYYERKVETEGVWVVPFLIDGSRWYREVESEPWWRGWFGPPKVKKGFMGVRGDIESEPTRLVLDKNVGKVEWKEDGLWWSGGEKGLVFLEKGWRGRGWEVSGIEYVDWNGESHPVRMGRDEGDDELRLEWVRGDEIFLWMRIEGGENSNWSLGGRPELWGEVLEEQYAYVWPEPRQREVSGEESVVYVHNRVAVAGRNPVRLVVLLYDESGLGVVGDKSLEIEIEGEGIRTDLRSQQKRQVQLIDLFSKRIQKGKVGIKIGDKVVEKKVWWAPNCKEDWRYCLGHLRKSWWYLRGVGGDWLRRVVLGENQ